MEIQAKYEGYIQRQEVQVEQFSKLEAVVLPYDLDYASMRALSHEGKEKLSSIRPLSLGQASRIPGLRPGDLQILYIHVSREAGNRYAGS